MVLLHKEVPRIQLMSLMSLAFVSHTQFCKIKRTKIKQEFPYNPRWQVSSVNNIDIANPFKLASITFGILTPKRNT